MAHITGEYIGFDVDPCPLFVGAEKGFTHCDRDDGEAKPIPHHLVDGEADPIDGDGAFGGDEGDKFMSHIDDHIVAVAIVGDGADGADGVDMSLDDVPLETIPHHHGGFDMDVSAQFFGSNVFEGFGGEFDAKSVAFDAHDREAGAVDSNRITELWFMRRFEGQSISSKAFDTCHLSNQTCKHKTPLLKDYFTLFLQRADNSFRFFVTVIRRFATPL
jgi:hypothetical protein